MADIRLSRNAVGLVRARLGRLDIAVISDIEGHRYLTTRQIARLHFHNKPTEMAALRATNRALARLSGLKLISPLERRIGGVRAGSGSYVWRLASLGFRVLHESERGDGQPLRRREVEPSLYFLEHTLAIAEVHVSLVEADRAGYIRLTGLQLEPHCWRPYNSMGGSTLRLKPDMAATTESDDYEDHWFFEVDLGSEAPSRVLRKCQQYEQYLHTGLEQRRIGVFPAVAWIVPDVARRGLLAARIGAEVGLTLGLHRVICPEDLDDLLQGRIESVNHGKAGGTP